MRALYDSKSKLDDRGIKALLSETEKYRTWLKVEAALALAQAEEGFIPREAAEDIASVRFEDLDLEEMDRIKARVGHGFVPFVKVLVKACRGEELTRTLHVNRERMLQNVNLNRGLDNSEYVMMNVAAKLGKDKAHELMYDKAMKVELEGRDYLSVLLEDDGITAMFSEEELRSMIDPASYTGLCSEIAADMAGKAKAAAGELRKRLG